MLKFLIRYYVRDNNGTSLNSLAHLIDYKSGSQYFFKSKPCPLLLVIFLEMNYDFENFKLRQRINMQRHNYYLGTSKVNELFFKD